MVDGPDPNDPTNYLVPPCISEAYLAKVLIQHGQVQGQKLLDDYVGALKNIKSRAPELLAIGRYRAAKVLGLRDHTSAAVIEALCDRLEQLEHG